MQDQSMQLKNALESSKNDSPIQKATEESLQELSKGDLELIKEIERQGEPDSLNMSNLNESQRSPRVDVVYMTGGVEKTEPSVNESAVRKEVEQSSRIVMYEEQKSREEVELKNALLKEELDQAQEQIKNLTDILEGFKAKS